MAGPLFLKINILKERKVTAAVFDFNLYLFKAKGNLNDKSPNVTIDLSDVKISPKKDNR